MTNEFSDLDLMDGAKKDGPVFIADMAQLQKQLSKKNKRRPVIGGQLLMVSLEPLKNQPGFVSQDPRKITGKMFNRAKADVGLHVAIDKDALDLLVKSRYRPAFLVDGMLKHGLKIKGAEEHCLIGAIAGVTSTQVLVLKFKRQTLVSYNEYQLAAPSLNTYEADLQLLLERLIVTSNGAQLHWCGPLPKPKLQRVLEVGKPVWALAPVQSLTSAGKAPFSRVHGIPLALALVGALGYAAAAYVPYQSYLTARAELAAESKTLQGETAFSMDRLSNLRSRQGFFEKKAAKNKRYESFASLLGTFGQIPKLKVVSATLFNSAESAKSRAGRSSRPLGFEVVVTVPRSGAYDSALDQGNAVLRELSLRTGLELRIATDAGGISSDSKELGKVGASIQYKIQGELL